MRRTAMWSCLACLASGCEGGSDPAGPEPEGDGDGDADADADADVGDAPLAEALSGRWELEGVSCAGTQLLAPFDGARVALEVDLDGATLQMSLTRVTCVVTLPFALSIDEEASALSAEPSGTIGCAP